MIKVENIDFSYQDNKKILDNLSFEVPKNSIFGFLGENGSGKTTTIRVLLNLHKADSGKVLIENKKLHYKDYKNIGTLIESPTFYQQLSGKENLKILAKYFQIGDERIQEVLNLVGLSKSQNLAVKKYSLGMKQRLGIAQSILHNPDILILDEPINGLDPRGIKEIRELLFTLKKQGKTIFISSHLLDEIEKTCDYVCIIDEGKKIFSGKVSDLQNQKLSENTITIHCNNSQKASELIAGKFQKTTTIINPKEFQFSISQNENTSEYVKFLVNQNIDLFDVTKNETSLEDLFLTLTKK